MESREVLSLRASFTRCVAPGIPGAASPRNPCNPCNPWMSFLRRGLLIFRLKPEATRYLNFSDRITPHFANRNDAATRRQPNPYFTDRLKFMDEASGA